MYVALIQHVLILIGYILICFRKEVIMPEENSPNKVQDWLLSQCKEAEAVTEIPSLEFDEQGRAHDMFSRIFRI